MPPGVVTNGGAVTDALRRRNIGLGLVSGASMHLNSLTIAGETKHRARNVEFAFTSRHGSGYRHG
jgi:hypothetical protein